MGPQPFRINVDSRGLTEWLGTLEGLSKGLLTASLAVAALASALQGYIAPAAKALGVPQVVVLLAVGVLIIGLVVWVWLSYSRYAKLSRLEIPERFTLAATTPESLVGRLDEGDQPGDLSRLIRTVQLNRIVLLDGESGCGKSALVAAGLVPRLLSGSGLLPILVREWGDEWVRGPLAATLDAFWNALTPEQRASIQWRAEPDLAAGVVDLCHELTVLLDATMLVLGRRPLLIADQFDDYQAQHRDSFLDDRANWKTPEAIAEENSFWGLVQRLLVGGQLHLLAITRNDTSNGLNSVRFLQESVVARTLLRVNVDYLRPLLANVAPDNAQPCVVSNPDRGWTDLRERLEKDLRNEGAILMQQVRVLLLGLRGLNVLTPAAYQRAGELRGLEKLVISRALENAVAQAGGGHVTLETARTVLSAMTLQGGPNQPPKAQRCTWLSLVGLVGSPSITRLLIDALQQDGIVRPTAGPGRDSGWQLDHDYLARAVLAESRQADRWGAELREGAARWASARKMRELWAALLPVADQMGIAYARARGRIRYGDAKIYALVSTLKPALWSTAVGLIFWASLTWIADQQLTTQARSIFDRFGGPKGNEAVLEVWGAPEAVRKKLYALLAGSPDRLDIAVQQGWPVADSGLDQIEMRKNCRLIEQRLFMIQNDPDLLNFYTNSYAAVARRLTIESDVKTAAEVLRSVATKISPSLSNTLARAYTMVVGRLNTERDLLTEAMALRSGLVAGGSQGAMLYYNAAYPAVASRLKVEGDAKGEAEALRIDVMSSRKNIGLYEGAYDAVAAILIGEKDVKAEAEALRNGLISEIGSGYAPFYAKAYAAVAGKLSEENDVETEVEALRSRVETADNDIIAGFYAEAYAAVAAKLVAANPLKAAANVLRTKMVAASNGDLATSYAVVASKLTDEGDLKTAAGSLQYKLTSSNVEPVIAAYTSAYAAVASKFRKESDLVVAVSILRNQLLYPRSNSFVTGGLAQAYATVASKLTDERDIKVEAEALGNKLANTTDLLLSNYYADAYSVVAGRLKEENDLRSEAGVLRNRLVSSQMLLYGDSFSKAYAAVASRLMIEDDIEVEAEALADRLYSVKGDDITATATAAADARAYAAVASKLTNQQGIAKEAEVLRKKLIAVSERSLARSYAEAYATVAARLLNKDDLRDAVETLHGKALTAFDAENADPFAVEYASLASAYIKLLRTGSANPALGAIPRDIIVLLGHPFSTDLSALANAAGIAAERNFAGEPLAALAWWQQTTHEETSTLRPSVELNHQNAN